MKSIECQTENIQECDTLKKISQIKSNINESVSTPPSFIVLDLYKYKLSKYIYFLIQVSKHRFRLENTNTFDNHI